MSVQKLKKDIFLHKASHLYYNRWTNAGGTWEPGTHTFDIVDILADTIAIEQGDPTEETIDWEFGDTPLMKSYTKGERTIAASCIDMSFDIMKEVFGWTVHDDGSGNDLMAAEKSSEEDYATIVIMFHGTTAPVIVLPKVSMSSKTTIGTLKTSTGQADLSGTAQQGYVQYSTANDTTEFAMIKPIDGNTIEVANNSEETPVAIGEIAIENGEFKLADAGSATVATVVTLEVSNIGTTTAYAGGSITSDGGSGITDCGVVVGTSANPTIGGAGVLKFSMPLDGALRQITGLTSGESYYARAYAINSVGTAYGADDSFTTN